MFTVSMNNTFVKEEIITDEETEDVDLSDDTIVVSCGSLTGLLHMSKFLCPGIRQPCIQVGAETELISPKDFTIRANKDRQKDWKGSIRMGRNSVRTLMETKKLDFYNHATFCSAKCQSRNYITPKEISDNMIPSSSSSSLRRQSLPARSRHKNDDITLEDILKIPEFSHLLKMKESEIEEKKEEASKNSLKDILNKPPILDNATSAEVEELCRKMNSDPNAFWTELLKMSVADEIIDQMISSLNTMRSKLKYGNINNVAPFLSRSVTSLGMNDRVRNSINVRKTHLRTQRLNENGTSFIPRKPILGEIVQAKITPASTSSPSVRSSIDFSSLEEPELALNKSRKRSLPFKFDATNNEPLLKKDLLPNHLEVKKEIDFELEPKDSFEIDTTNILLMNQSQSSQDLLMQIAASIGEST
ncbi:unnamed protein product [Caenorhabditis angaria]|uniref:SAND domain-containing protein n=1 Tax=Caenorhabditis angaria TaxID=860376 RepID=A0A9P1N1E3_9PELO|nr:unnamed protein product [Caenorhabditis angaria]